MRNKEAHWSVVERLLDERAHAAAEIGDREEKLRTKNAYEWFNRKLNEMTCGRYLYSLNYGYVENENPTWSIITPPPGQFDLNSRRLVLEVIGNCPVNGRDILDISCGRGSVAAVLRAYFRPRSYRGIDISSEAIAFCRKYQQTQDFSFEEGDAEAMAVGTATFDVVINIEASHDYPSLHAFIREVHRVLRPGGWFLYTDLGTPRHFERGIRLARHAGLQLSRDVDITSNVLLSCREAAERRLKVYDDAEERAMMTEFFAAPGSRIGLAFEDGSLCYRLLTFRKPDASMELSSGALA